MNTVCQWYVMMADRLINKGLDDLYTRYRAYETSETYPLKNLVSADCVWNRLIVGFYLSVDVNVSEGEAFLCVKLVSYHHLLNPLIIVLYNRIRLKVSSNLDEKKGTVISNSIIAEHNAAHCI
jgi:hypothetical protein